MATTLDKLARIVDGLAGLGEAGKGTPLRAADWNLLVGAVRDLAALVAAREQGTQDSLEARFAPNPHSHVGEADLTWFEPTTRALLESKSTATPDLAANVRLLRQDLSTTQADVADLKSQLSALQDRVDNVLSRDTDREASVSRLGSRVEALRDLGAQVNDVGTRYQAIADRLERVSGLDTAINERLGGVEGLVAIQTQLGGLDSLKTSLTLADGSLLRARDFETRIAGLEKTTVTDARLDDALVTRLKSGAVLEQSGVIDAAARKVQDSIAQPLQVLTDGLGRATDQLGTATADLAALKGTASNLDSRVGATESAVSDLAGLKDVQARLGGRLDQAEATLSQHGSQLSAIPDALSRVEGLATTSAAALTDRVTQMEGKVSSLSVATVDLGPVESRLGTLEDRTKDLPTAAQFSALSTSVDDATRGLSASGARLDAAEARLDDLAKTPDRLSSLEDFARSTSSWRSAADSQLSKLNLAISAVPSLSSRLDAAESSLTKLSAWQTTASVTLASVSTLTSSVSALTTRVAMAEGSLTSLTSRVGSAESRAALAENRLSTVESSVGKMANAGFVTADTFGTLVSRVGSLESTPGRVLTSTNVLFTPR